MNRKGWKMATSLNMSVYGLYYYRPDLFANMVLPDEIDKDVMIANIIMECAELTILYPDADMLKEAIGYWSNARLNVWQRMAEVLYADYDPFINIKRDEERTITYEPNLKGEGNSTTTVNAWNDGTGVERDSTKTNTSETGKSVTTEKFHVEGDSAITDAQDVARKEFELRDRYELYKYIVNDFRNKFCLMIY